MENNFQFTSAAVTDRGLSDKRPQNEDSYLELAEHGVFAVADGVGGAQAGDVASQMAVEILAEAFVNRPPNADAEETMKAAIERANTAIFQMSHDLAQLSSMATTIVALHVDGNIATIGHVGDSRVYRADNNRRLFRETEDHSVVEEEVRAGRMTPEQALTHPSRNIISRALGAEESVEIDIKTIMVDGGTSFLLCSDGITRHIDDAEINEFLTSDAEPAAICASMKELCYRRGAEDNLTAVVVRLPMTAADAPTQDLQIPAETVLPADAQTARTPQVVEEEEDTIAATRSPFDSVATHEPEHLPQAEPVHAEEAAALTERSTGYVSSSVIVAADNTAAEPEQPVYSSVGQDPAVASGNGFFGKVLTGLGLLVLGLILGFAAHYWLAGSLEQPEPQPQEIPVITEQKSENVKLTSFENGRRVVDRDPKGYIEATAAAPPEKPEDFFLLGRAYFLTGQQWDAKRNFIEARNRLSQAEEENVQTLATEISMALVIIESGPATQAFQRELEAAKPAPAANTATDANSITPAG